MAFSNIFSHSSASFFSFTSMLVTLYNLFAQNAVLLGMIITTIIQIVKETIMLILELFEITDVSIPREQKQAINSVEKRRKHKTSMMKVVCIEIFPSSKMVSMLVKTPINWMEISVVTLPKSFANKKAVLDKE